MVDMNGPSDDDGSMPVAIGEEKRQSLRNTTEFYARAAREEQLEYKDLNRFRPTLSPQATCREIGWKCVAKKPVMKKRPSLAP
jgi:hypothetical protein